MGGINYAFTYKLSSASSVTCLGQEFRTGGIVCVDRPCDTEYPVFGEIRHVIVEEDGSKHLALVLYNTEEFSHHYFAYKLHLTNTYKVFPINKLAFHQIYHKYNNFFVVMRSCDHIEHLI